MKLLYITNGINGAGGLERVLSVKASMLADDYGYQVHILCLNDSHQNRFYNFSHQIHFHSIPVKGNLFAYLRSYRKGIRKVVKEVQPDVISVCDDGLKGFYVPSFLKTKAKIIYERHASVNLNAGSGIKGNLIRILMHRQISKFDRFVVLTKGNLKEWNQPNVTVIPNPIGFQSEQSAELENKKIIAVGSHSYNKGYDLLIRVWKIIQNQKPDWELNIYGKIDTDRTFVKIAEKEGLKNIFFKPPIKDIRSAYLDASILVMSSRSEGFGMVLTEAMECGLPCVAFDCPSGPADIISEGEDGFLIEPENTNQMVDRLLQLIEDKTLRKQMGKTAKQNVKRFSADEILKKWDDLFNELLNKDQSTEKIK
ncbi:MAG: glycosyltransferase family 4 protein [Weeksellaceae bacterium]